MKKNLKRKPQITSKPEKKQKTLQSLINPPLTPLKTSEVHEFPHPEVHIISWNVNGLRAWIKKQGVLDFINRPEFDIICFNETKLQEKHVLDFKPKFPQYPYQYWSCSTERLGYSGTAILSKVKPLSWKSGLPSHPNEGRLILAEFPNFYLLATYVPNTISGRSQYRLEKWDRDLSQYIQNLENSGKGVIWIGDLNVINTDIDVYQLEGNEDCCGGTPEERKSFHNIIQDNLIDTFRHLHPDTRQYTWFNTMRKVAKSRNEGWRFDMSLISKALIPQVKDSKIYDQIYGSDHYPIELIMINGI